jgi:hypothetical protein
VLEDQNAFLTGFSNSVKRAGRHAT